MRPCCGCRKGEVGGNKASTATLLAKEDREKSLTPNPSPKREGSDMFMIGV